MPDNSSQSQSANGDYVSQPKDTELNEPLAQEGQSRESESSPTDVVEESLAVTNEPNRATNSKERDLGLDANEMEVLLRERLKAEEEIPEVDKRRILNDIENGMALWHKMASLLHLTLILLGATALISSLYITAFTGSCALSTLGIRVLSFISALCLTAITAFNLNGKGRGVRKGWRHMKDAVFKYKAKKISLAELIQASSEAEEMLGYVDFQADSMRKVQDRSEPTKPIPLVPEP